MPARIKRPSRIKIFNLTYKIKFTGTTEHQASEADGWCDYDNQVIVLYEKLSPESMADCFLHECIHAIAHSMNILFKDEEQVARRLATGICTLWRDNKTAYRWWSSLL